MGTVSRNTVSQDDIHRVICSCPILVTVRQTAPFRRRQVCALNVTGIIIKLTYQPSFVVQWPDLLSDGKRGVYRGWMV